jgi:hypothetical protein
MEGAQGWSDQGSEDSPVGQSQEENFRNSEGRETESRKTKGGREEQVSRKR